MANYRKPDGSTHRCSVPGCNERKTFKIAKSMGRSPLFICRACMAHITGAFAKLFPEEFAAKFAVVKNSEDNPSTTDDEVTPTTAGVNEPPQSPEGASSPDGGAASADGEGAEKDALEKDPADDAAGASPSPTADVDTVELTEESLKGLKREELDKLLVERGLDPKDYANRGECVKALLGEQ